MTQDRHAEFNESTYATIVTAQLTSWLQQHGALRGVPITPTLKAEADLGYDVATPAKWGMIYLQYKLAEYMRGSNARERAWLRGNYFRFKVKTDMTKNGKVQHNTLCELEARELPRGGLVFYTAPIFLTVEDLFKHLSEGTVLEHSVFALPSQLGKVTAGDLHRYTYTKKSDVRPFSEPGPERSASFAEFQREVSVALEASETESLTKYLGDTVAALAQLSEVASPGAAGVPRGRLGTDGETSRVQQLSGLAASLDLQPILLRQADNTITTASS